MIKVYFKFLLLCTVSMLLSCDNGSKTRTDSTVGTFKVGEKDYEALNAQINELENAINLGQLLRNNPKRSLNQIYGAIAGARDGLQLMFRYGFDDKERLQDAFDALTTAIGQYDAYGVLDFEKFRFDQVFNQIKELRYLAAKNLGIEDSYTWVVYAENFADGIEPNFISFPGKAQFGVIEWVTNFQIDIPKAKASGRNGHAWMVSQPFSLEGIEDPSFRFFSAYSAVAPTPRNSLKDVINKAFKTYVILDLTDGENPQDIEDSRKILVDYNIDEIPLGRDFHDDWVPFESLEKFRGHKVSIGFMYDTREETLGKEQNYYSWDIFDFELRARGVFKNPISTIDLDFKATKKYELELYSNKWQSSVDGKSLKVSSGVFSTKTLMLSPLYSILSNVSSPKLYIKDLISGVGPGVAKVLVSEDYKGGVDPLASNVKWTVLDEGNVSRIETRKAYDLKPYIGKSVVFAFLMESPAGSDFEWELKQVDFSYMGGVLFPSDISVPDIESQFYIGSYNFLNDDFKSFKQILEDKESSPKWRGLREGAVVSGFNGVNEPKDLGSSRMILGVVDLKDVFNIKYRIRHAMKHVKDLDNLKVQAREACEDSKNCENPWITLNFPEGVFQRFVDDMTTSPWVSLKEELLNKKVEFSFIYDGTEESTPEWRVESFEIGGVK